MARRSGDRCPPGHLSLLQHALDLLTPLVGRRWSRIVVAVILVVTVVLVQLFDKENVCLIVPEMTGCQPVTPRN